MSRSSLTRRDFLWNTSLTAAGLWLGSRTAWGKNDSPNNKLNVAVIGTANRAEGNIGGVMNENIVALCDIDDNYLDHMHQKYPRARQYNDWRKMLEQKDIDAVVVSTADHTHAVATLAAMSLGKHVYCEKPLAHSLYEIRLVRDMAANNPKLATQMGTQIHAENNYRRVVELVQSGAIGNVKECHVWCGKSWKARYRSASRPPPVPPNIHWDLWLGPAMERPYRPEYLPLKWRRYWDFGNGTLGDMGCHYMDLAFWALNLRTPLTVEAEGPPVDSYTAPAWLIVRYEYEARDKMPPVKVTWYDGGKKPEIITKGKGYNWSAGVLFIGDKGMLQADYEHCELLPKRKFKGFVRPPHTIPDSIGHHAEWIQACKTGSPTLCNFDYSGALSEAILLGNVAYRSQQKIEWDSESLTATNCKEAERFIHPHFRHGWNI